jgi:hypothetical protein
MNLNGGYFILRSVHRRNNVPLASLENKEISPEENELENNQNSFFQQPLNQKSFSFAKIFSWMVPSGGSVRAFISLR